VVAAVPAGRFSAVQPHDGVGGGGDLVERRARKTPLQDGFELLTVDHGASQVR
jgi:hypothetical protein